MPPAPIRWQPSHTLPLRYGARCPSERSLSAEAEAAITQAPDQSAITRPERDARV